ncbi:transposase [Rhodococcoides fascians]|uniref:transposase n=1 Tax=Rhodococcoides fascians TaxID=1828 RepID=UPI00068A651C|nr:transposase [Rhodococcus fascians]
MRGRTFPAEIRNRAVELVSELIPSSRSTWAAIERTAAHMGLHPNTVRFWYRQAQGVTDERPLLPSEQSDEIARLRAELARAQQLNAELITDNSHEHLRHHTTATWNERTAL